MKRIPYLVPVLALGLTGCIASDITDAVAAITALSSLWALLGGA